MRSNLTRPAQAVGVGRTMKLAAAVLFSALLFISILSQRTVHANSVAQEPEAQNPASHHEHGAQHDQEKAPVKPEHQRDQSTPPAPAKEQEHHHDTGTPGQKKDAAKHDMSKMKDEHSSHDMSDEHGDHDMGAMMNTVTGGPFRSMHAMGSGTSLLPASSPGYMWHWMKSDWMIAAHGDLKIGFNHQGGPRGINKAESQNWLMLMAERPAGGGRLMLRGMFSAEPLTAPRRGFPELFQVGETFDGRPIVDAQHPHDLFMELAAQYTLPLSENISINLYGGPVAEPALGPVAFMHRTSASENPAAPLSHHWQDSTHITHGVFTAGVTAWRFRVEGSIFRGAEPDENRKDIELGKLDSYSGRIWFTPTPDWVFQFSRGHLTNPEAASPGNLDRTTASVSYNRAWLDGNWASSLIWGRNHEEHGNSNAYLFESTANFMDKNYLYTRLELVDRIGLLRENIFGRAGLIDDSHHSGDDVEMDGHFEPVFRVGAFTFGGVRDIFADPKWRLGVGADVTFYHVPAALEPIYGSNPTSFHLFLRLRPGKMEH